MMEKMGGSLGIAINATVKMQQALHAGAALRGDWKLWHYRQGEVIGIDEWHNIVTNEGIEYLLEAGLAVDSVTQEASWYVGLIKVSSPTIVNADTLAVHAGWSEADPGTDYTGDRQAWVGAAATGTTTKTTTNSASKASFPILGTFVASGAFLASVATGTGGILYAAGEYTGGDRSVQNGDTLEIQADFTTVDDV
jgi:hypothetical protein